MSKISKTVNNPVRDLQMYLRTISLATNEIPLIIPDGKFGTKTREAVLAFQKKVDFPQTGEVDELLWNKIISVYEDASELMKEPSKAVIYPSAQCIINQNDKENCVIIIQAMMSVLSGNFSNLGNVDITGINDEKTQTMLKRLQNCFGTDETGIIDRTFWDNLVGLYEATSMPHYIIKKQKA